MTLELRFRRFWFLPDLAQTGNGEPRKAHFLGKRAPVPVEKQEQGQGDDNSPRREDPGKYRPLSDITLGEVDAAIRHFMPQLVASPADGWIARNYFCQIPIKQKRRAWSPVVFGRVQTTFPSDGNIQNVEQLELLLPNQGAGPDLVHIHRDDIQWQRPVHSYCVGVRMFLSDGEVEDFRRSEDNFIGRGFAPIYEGNPLDLLDMSEQGQASPLWLNVVGSEWFASLPDTIQPEIRERLRDMADWGLLLFNYHPRRYSLRYLSLNEELDFNYGFTRHYLLAPQDTTQALKTLEESFGEIYLQGIG